MARQIVINPETDAVINVDIMPTFMPGGGLPVRNGNFVVPVGKKVASLFPKARRYACRDRHPKGHISFASSYIGIEPFTALTAAEVADWSEESHLIAPDAKFTLEQLKAYLEKVRVQMLWTDHGTIGTPQAELHHELPEEFYGYVQDKGMDPACDSYSAFIDNLGRPTGLGDRMRRDMVKRLVIGADLAFDFCGGWTGINAAREEGFEEVFLCVDGSRSVDVPGTKLVMGSVEKRLHELVDAGVQLIHSRQLVAA